MFTCAGHPDISRVFGSSQARVDQRSSASNIVRDQSPAAKINVVVTRRSCRATPMPSHITYRSRRNPSNLKIATECLDLVTYARWRGRDPAVHQSVIDTKGRQSVTILKRIAAGTAVLALAFTALAGTELPAEADAPRPAGPISVLPQSGPSPQLFGVSTVAKASVVKKKSKKKKKSKGAKALAFAKRQLGDRYRYGGTGPNSWDCSGLTQRSWKAAGKKIPRTSQAQSRFGKKVKKSKLKKGDLVFFYSGKSHVGIYAGKGKVIHASRPGKPVAYIKMKYMPYAGARRPG